jgi:serine/threonine protein kinase
MQSDRDASLSDEATFAGRPRPQRADVSIGDERTSGDELSGQDTIIDDLKGDECESRYRIEGTLGQGGMGAVLLATDTRLDRKVAIKRILGEAAGNRLAVQRFLTEAKSIAALNHPNIVQIYDYGRAKDGPFLIMEFVDGGSLLDSCRDGAMPLESAVDMACQLCDGLAKAHELGIIHRDIKPANVLLTKDGTPKLTDFGLAKAQSGDHGQTMTGAVLGTPDFMPPEQRRDASLADHRSDLWSLAATVYQMVTGRSPKIIRFDLLPPELTKVLGKALEDSKDDRYQTATELRDALKAVVRITAGPFTGELVEGRCPACGVQNDLSRKFCKGCGGSLIAPCLKCDDAIPIWDEICGSCGARQSLLVDSRRREMAAKQAEAEGLLGECNFAGANEIAAQLRERPHPKLRYLMEWATAFLERIENSQSEQMRQAADAMKAAYKHEAVHDYPSAAHSLESIPKAMRGVELPGLREPAEQMLSRIKRTQGEAQRLEKLIRDRIASKSLDDLLPEVEKLRLLRPDRADVRRLHSQLVDQRQKQAERDTCVVQAQSFIDSGRHREALAVLSGVGRQEETQDVRHLRELAASMRDQECAELGNRIRKARASEQYDNVGELLRDYKAALEVTHETEDAFRNTEVAYEELMKSTLRKKARDDARSTEELIALAWWLCASPAAFALLHMTTGETVLSILAALILIVASGLFWVISGVALPYQCALFAVCLTCTVFVYVSGLFGLGLWLCLGLSIGFLVPWALGIWVRWPFVCDEVTRCDKVAEDVSRAVVRVSAAIDALALRPDCASHLHCSINLPAQKRWFTTTCD